MIRRLIVFLGLLASLTAFGQDGDYFLTHHIPPSVAIDHQIYDMVQNKQGMVFAAHRSGVLTYDGTIWQDIAAQTSIFSLEIFDDQTIYTGGPTGFQRLIRNKNFEYQLEQLNKPELVKDILRLIKKDSILYGMSPTNLYSYHTGTKKIEVYGSKESAEFSNLYAYENQIHVLDIQGNSYVLKNGTLRRELSGLGTKSLSFVTKAPNKEIYLAGDANNNLLIYRNGFENILNDYIDRKDLEYLKDSEITGGLWLNDTLAVISTLKGGVIFLQPLKKEQEKRNVLKIINYQTDLPDNEVFMMSLDNSNAVWVGHEKGLTRIVPQFPFRRFDRFRGLEGKIQAVNRHKGILYVGTTQGLFMLNETPVYEKVKKNFTEWVTVDRRTKKGLFNRLFSKKQSTREQRDVVKTVNEFHSIQYEYKKLSGVTSKVFQFSEIGGRLYSAGLDGIFEISGIKVKSLTNTPVKYVHFSSQRNRLFAATYNGDIIELQLFDQKIVTHEIFNNISEPVGHIFEDNKGRIFLMGMHTLFVLNKRDELEEIPFENPYYSQTYGVFNKDSVFLFIQSGIYTVNIEEKTITLAGDAPEQIVPGVGDQIWLKEVSGWRAPGLKTRKNTFQHLNVFDQIHFIAEAKTKDGLWVITEKGVDKNALYYLSPQESVGWHTISPLFLEKVITEDGNVSPYGEIRFEQEKSNITFVFRQPEFSGVMNTEYQYHLEGEEQEDWSTSSLVKFNYLPAGKYNLKIKSRNALGQVEMLDDIAFVVLPPYFKRTWFYALEFAIIALMLLISIRMKAMGYKYRLISRLLALLTLITIIELIQALAESKFETESSPVFGFIIQVLMAIMILPVEEILRKYIFREKNVKVFDLFSIRDKQSKKIRVPD